MVKHTFVKKDSTQTEASANYTVGDNVTKIFGSKLYGTSNPKKQLSADHIEATEKYELTIELPSSANEANYKVSVKYALFTNEADETPNKELQDVGSFDVPGYGK
ncbi:MAG: hypothetical protein ACTTKH_02395 [Treponema sp.]